jgi:hypothetical protein
LQSLRQLVVKEDAESAIRDVEIEDWPNVAFRRHPPVFARPREHRVLPPLPARFLALYKFNKVIVKSTPRCGWTGIRN